MKYFHTMFQMINFGVVVNENKMIRFCPRLEVVTYPHIYQSSATRIHAMHICIVIMSRKKSHHHLFFDVWHLILHSHNYLHAHAYSRHCIIGHVRMDSCCPPYLPLQSDGSVNIFHHHLVELNGTYSSAG